jgi:hypothetical protein
MALTTIMAFSAIRAGPLFDGGKIAVEAEKQPFWPYILNTAKGKKFAFLLGRSQPRSIRKS